MAKYSEINEGIEWYVFVHSVNPCIIRVNSWQLVEPPVFIDLTFAE